MIEWQLDLNKWRHRIAQVRKQSESRGWNVHYLLLFVGSLPSAAWVIVHPHTIDQVGIVRIVLLSVYTDSPTWNKIQRKSFQYIPTLSLYSKLHPPLLLLLYWGVCLCFNPAESNSLFPSLISLHQSSVDTLTHPYFDGKNKSPTSLGMVLKTK